MILAPAILAAHAAHIINASINYTIACKVDTAPQINISVTTDDIAYDYSQPSKALTDMHVDTKSPYPPGSDTVTGGLREDHPRIRTKMEWNIVYETKGNNGCLRYKKIDIDIHLQPKIYVASEFNTDVCRDAVLGHERKHVQVDREVMNKYANVIGTTVQSIVNQVGALGPFDMNNVEAVKKQSSDYIEKAMDQIEDVMAKDLHGRQQQVDSLQEYERVGSYCKNVKIEK